MSAMEGLARPDAAHAGANGRARAAFGVGLVAALAVPVGVGWAVWTYHVHGTPHLHPTYFAIPVAAMLGIVAVILGRGGMHVSWITLGRIGGGRLARAGWVLGMIGLYFALMGLLALAFYGILLLFQ
jgi:hypothetical protein